MRRKKKPTNHNIKKVIVKRRSSTLRITRKDPALKEEISIIIEPMNLSTCTTHVAQCSHPI